MQRRGLLMAAAVLAAPRIGRAATARTLRIVPQADLAVLDPVWTTVTQSRDHGFLVFDTLFGQDAAYTPQLQMLEARRGRGGWAAVAALVAARSALP